MSTSRNREEEGQASEESARIESQDPIIQQPSATVSESSVQLRRARPRPDSTLPVSEETPSQSGEPVTSQQHSRIHGRGVLALLSWKRGLLIMTLFIASFITVLTLRGLPRSPPRGFSLSAVYLGSLAAANTSLPTFVGALVAFVAIFAPGMIIVSGGMGFWKELRSRRWLVSLLRGVNAAAVGLVYTAVCRLWQIGLLDETRGNGSPLGGDPWWVAITATSFVVAGGLG